MSAEDPIKTLSSPLKIGHLTLANRVIMGPMAANAPGEDGTPTEQTIAFFERRARGGVGMIICGGMIATDRGFDEAPFRPVLRPNVEAYIPNFKRVADAVHKHNVPIIAEIMPAFGRMGVPTPERPIISASPKNIVIPQERFPTGIIVPGGRTTPEPQEASIEEVKQYEKEMIQTAVNVQRAGWDGVEVAAHMSYFAASFLSPRTNWRTDEYGGSVENRARFLANIVAGIREKVGSDFVVGLRITANDFMPDGQGVAGFAAVAKEVEKAGLDYVALSEGCYETMNASAPDDDGRLVDSGDARVFKEALSVPILIQGIHEAHRAGKAIAEGNGDAAMFARQMLAEPDYAKKVTEGRPETITRCIRDNTCMRRMIFQMPVRCDVNPEMGRESRHGKGAPLNRLAKAPVEKAVLALTGSQRLMAVAGAMMKKH
jgi:2,4-dienoyl-CoA reductase (NADPH2)